MKKSIIIGAAVAALAATTAYAQAGRGGVCWWGKDDCMTMVDGSVGQCRVRFCTVGMTGIIVKVSAETVLD